MSEQKPIQILNEADTAQYIGMSRVWLRQSRMHRTGPAYIRIGRAIRYALPDLDKFLENHRVKPKGSIY
jgi:predicted DNA-binding transcriptional regulator AlpA